MQDLHQAAIRLAPRVVSQAARKSDLDERLTLIREMEGANLLEVRPTTEQAAYLRASSLLNMAGVYLGSATTNLAHSPEAFAIISPTLDPGLAQHALDSVADEIAFAPLQGVSGEAAAMASLSSIEDDLKLATDHLDRASALIDSLPTRS